MKYISLITGSDLRFVMGVNYYLKSFIQCNEYFEDVVVNRVYSGSQTLKVDLGEAMPIGVGRGTTGYKLRTGVRTFLRKLLTDKFYPFKLFRTEMNRRTVSKNAIRRFFSDEHPCDYIIFEEIGVAEYYFKHIEKNPQGKNIKTMYVLHSADDSGELLHLNYKGVAYADMKRRSDKRRDYVYAHVDKIVYISQRAMNSGVASVGKRVCVYNGSPNIEYDFSIIKKDILNFVCVGNLSGGKGQEKILEAMALMDDAHLKKMHLTLVGGGNLSDEMVSQCHALGLDDYVSFLGVRNDVPEILKEMDVYIMPTKTEGLSMSGIEALRAGLFLILTDVGGNAELCDDGCGYLCTREPEDIVSKVYDVLDCGVVSKEQKARCHNHFLSHFSLETMAKGYETALKSL